MDQNRKNWNSQQQTLRHALTKGADQSRAIDLFLCQHAMVHSATMSESGLWSFEDEVRSGLTDADIRRIPADDEHSIAWIFWHIARIEDVTMNIVLSGGSQLLIQDMWNERLEVPYRDTGNGMDKVEIIHLSTVINIQSLFEYRRIVGRRTREIVSQLSINDFKQKVDARRLNRVFTEGAVVEGTRGLLDYWGSLTLGGLMLMPPTRHNFIHLNEALRILHKK